MKLYVLLQIYVTFEKINKCQKIQNYIRKFVLVDKPNCTINRNKQNIKSITEFPLVINFKFKYVQCGKTTGKPVPV